MWSMACSENQGSFRMGQAYGTHGDPQENMLKR